MKNEKNGKMTETEPNCMWERISFDTMRNMRTNRCAHVHVRTQTIEASYTATNWFHCLVCLRHDLTRCICFLGGEAIGFSLIESSHEHTHREKER